MTSFSSWEGEYGRPNDKCCKHGFEDSRDNKLASGDFALTAINTLNLHLLAGVIHFFSGEMIGFPVSCYVLQYQKAAFLR